MTETAIMAAATGAYTVIALTTLYLLTVDERFGDRFARLVGHRPIGDRGLDMMDVLARVTGWQGPLLLTGVMSGVTFVLALIDLCTGA